MRRSRTKRHRILNATVIACLVWSSIVLVSTPSVAANAQRLTNLVDHVVGKQNYLMIVTSDHAGHGKIHGSDHAEDHRLPLIVCSDSVDVKRFQGISFSVTELKQLLENLLDYSS